MKNEETICAISTPYGIGGIAVVRVSGNQAFTITDTLFHGKHKLTDCKSHTLHYGTIQRGEEVLDEVVVSVFKGSHSFTGEDTAEISCHGSLYIQQTLLQWLMEAGCRMAEAGEFTRRAFQNGKLKLTEAEAVADLIAAENKAAHDLAMNGLRGGIDNEIHLLRDKLLNFTALLELGLDFADHEDIEIIDQHELLPLVEEIDAHISQLLDSFRWGNAVKNGIPVAIVGEPNVGKSTLLNALLGEDRAIVSATAGTTRDTIEDTLNLNGILFRFIDTAGLRETDNAIEQEGIARSYKAIEKAEIVLYLTDLPPTPSQGGGEPTLHTPLSSPAQEESLDFGDKYVIHVYNKADLLKDTPSLGGGKGEVLFGGGKGDVLLSAKFGTGIDRLKELLTEYALNQQKIGCTVISNARHANSLRKALEAVRSVKKGILNNLSGELVAMDLNDCLNALGDITGEITNDAVLGTIFSKFCIGK